MLLLLLTACLYDRAQYLAYTEEFADDDADGHPGYHDCDDENPDINPDQDEVCDGVDNDCDDGIDNDALDTQRWYQDLDQDGFGNTEITREGCLPPKGYADNGTDCDDDDATIYPAAEESCAEAVDRNCDGQPGNQDSDQDGSPACVDCNDSNPAINPDQVEVCDFVDQNCDNQIDNDAQDARIWYADADGDGYGDPATEVLACYPPTGEHITASGDCDDRDVTIKPGAEEVCGDGVDNNCNSTPDDCRPEGDLDVGTVLTNNQNNFLNSAIGIGDVNFDGYEDLALGSNELVGTPNGQGGSFSILLGPLATGTLDIETTASLFVTGTESFTGVGQDLSPALDYNGDGLTEVAISSSYLGNTISSAVHLIPISRRGPITVEQAEFGRLTSTTDDYFTLGGIMYGTEDIDGDHADELLIGSPNAYRNGVESSGTLYHISGAFVTNSTAASVAKTTFLGDEYDGLGDVVLQDVNGDGDKDYILGAYYNATGGTDAGILYTFYGPLSGTLQMSQADVAQTGIAGESLGEPLVTAADLDGDGLEDLWATALYSSLPGTDAGAVYLLPATATSRDARANAIASLSGESSGDLFGVDIAVVDMDADTRQDILVGAAWQGQGGEKSGKAYLFYGPFAGAIDARDAEGSYVGYAVGAMGGDCVSSVGDLNADGQPDLAICEPSTNPATNAQISLIYGYSF